MRRLLAVLLVLLLAIPASATTLYMSGMEMGFPRVNSGDEEDVFALGGTFNQVIVHTGAWSLKQVATNTFLTAALNTPTLGARFYFYAVGDGSGLPAPSLAYLVQFRTTAVVVLFRVVLANTTPRVLSISSGGAGFSTVNGTTEITADRWHRIDLAYDAASGGIGKVWLDGTLEISTTHTGAQANVNQISVDGPASGTTPHYFDDVFVIDTATQPPDGVLIVRQGVSGTPTDDAWTKVGCTPIEDCWSATGFSTAQSANSGSTTSSVAQTMVVHPFTTAQAGHGGVTTTGGVTVNAVQIGLVAKTSATSSGGATGSIRRYVNGAGPTDDAVTLTTGDRGFKSPFFTDSFGNLDLYEIGFVKAASAAARTQTVEDMWMMVDFLPPTATAVRHRVTQ